MINPISDVNSRLADEKEQRLKRIRLIERETAEQAPIWQAKQATLYPTAIPISQTPTLGQIITEETQKGLTNEDTLYQRAEQKLKQIADNANVEYILDRLDLAELSYVVNNWDGLLKEITEKFNKTGLQKDMFIVLVKKRAETLVNEFGQSNVGLTKKGKLKEDQREEKLYELQNELDQKKAEEEAENQKRGAERVKQEDELKKQEDERLAKKKAMKSIEGRIKIRLAQKEKDKLKAQAEKQKEEAESQSRISDIVQEVNNEVHDDIPLSSKFKKLNLYGEFKDQFDVAETNLEETFKTLKREDYEKMYEIFDKGYPKKFSYASGLGDVNKVKNFLKAIILEVFLEKQMNSQKKSFESFDEKISRMPQTPPKTNNDYDDRLRELSSMKIVDLKPIAKQLTGKSTFPNKHEIINKILEAEFPNMTISPKIKMTGIGLKKRRRRIVGCGMGVNEYNKSKETVMKKIINGKYIDLNKLKNNIICIRYCKTRALIPSVKVQHINNDVKEIIDDIINDKFEKRLYEKLDVNDKRLIKRIVDALKLDLDLKDKTDEEYQRQFEIVLGEYRAGSTSPLIKHKLKQYIMESLESGMIPRRQAFSLLFELANS